MGMGLEFVNDFSVKVQVRDERNREPTPLREAPALSHRKLAALAPNPKIKVLADEKLR
jgi:hypothetical protein